MPSLSYRSLASSQAMYGDDVIEKLLGEGQETYDPGMNDLLRVTTAYWKSQRKLGHLTKILENGEVMTEVITEEYKVTDKPIYDNRLIKNKNKDTLVFGEHIDWIWINEVWGGIKIGPNIPSYWGMNNPEGKIKEE